MAFGNGGYQWLLVCLGNPGREYEETRHNIGFLTADALERREGVKINKLRYRALTGEFRAGGQRVLVLKPQTYMNLSGEAVKLAGGLALVAAVKSLLKAPLLALYAGVPIAHSVRYFLVVLTAGCLWPMTFRVFARYAK